MIALISVSNTCFVSFVLDHDKVHRLKDKQWPFAQKQPPSGKPGPSIYSTVALLFLFRHAFEHIPRMKGRSQAINFLTSLVFYIVAWRTPYYFYICLGNDSLRNQLKCMLSLLVIFVFAFALVKSTIFY